MLRTSVATDSSEKAILLSKLEVARIPASSQLLTGEQRAENQANESEQGENGVVPREAVESKEEARDAACCGFGLDFGRVLGYFVDGFEDRGARGPDRFAGDGGVPEAAVL